MPDLSPPRFTVRDAVQVALAEDLLPLGDITSSLLPPEVRGTASFISEAEGVIAGVECVVETFNQVDPSIKTSWQVHDGTEVAVDDVLGRVEGPLASIMAAEPTALNFLTHLSGIASLTRRYVRASQNKIKVRDTSHTTPGLRALEKAAVRCGGGINHRGSLSDGVLLRDQHFVQISIADAVRRSRMRWPDRFIEVRCDSLDTINEAVESKPDMIMLNNFSPSDAKAAVDMIGGQMSVEVYGPVDIREMDQYVSAGVDLVSVSGLTNAAPAFNIRLEVQAL